MNAATMVQFSGVDLKKLLPLGRTALNRNLAAAADQAGHEPPLHHMLCISSIKTPAANTVNCIKPYLNMFHAGFMVAADERDFAEIMELCGMPCVMVESVQRGVNLAFIAGNLSQWRDAIFRGCQNEVSCEVREIFNKIYVGFRDVGLSAAFEFKSEVYEDATFTLKKIT
jgi:hypothetical protein